MKQEIEENLKNVEEGKPLTIPLSVLNGEFKRIYKEKYGDSAQILSKTPKRNTKKLQSDKYKAYQKAYKKAYYQRMKLIKLKEKGKMKQTKIEKIEDMNLKLKIKVKCAVGEEQEVKTRLLNMIISHIKSMEGLFTTSWLPWSKSYYFSVREVIIV